MTWLLWSAALLTLIVAAFLVPPLLVGDADPGAASGEQLGRAAQDQPTFDDVLRIRDELRADAAANLDYPIDEATLASVITAPGEYTPLGRIGFPTTGLDVEFAGGVQPSVLERGPGHWPGTAMPGQVGNSVLSGHRTTYTHPFADLDLLNVGDPIAVRPTGAAAPTVYRVTETTIVLEAEYVDFVLRQPAEPTVQELTLFACHPKGDRTHRIVVRAVAEPLTRGR